MHRSPRAVRAMPPGRHPDTQANQAIHKQTPKAGIPTICSQQQNFARSSLQRHGLAGEQLANTICNPMAFCLIQFASREVRKQQTHNFWVLQEADQQQAELPTRMNDIPHHRDKRRWFYNEVTQAMLTALSDGQTRMRIRQVSRL